MLLTYLIFYLFLSQNKINTTCYLLFLDLLSRVRIFLPLSLYTLLTFQHSFLFSTFLRRTKIITAFFRIYKGKRQLKFFLSSISTFS